MCDLILLFRENTATSVGDIACNFGCGNVNKIESSADVDKINFFNQELWNNFIFGFIDRYKYEDHVENIVDYIVTNHNLKFVKRISDLDYSDTDVIMNHALCNLVNAY